MPSKVLRWRSSVQVPVKGGMVLFWAGAKAVSARRQRARCFMAEVYFNVQRKLEVGEGKVDVEDDGADGAVWDG